MEGYFLWLLPKKCAKSALQSNHIFWYVTPEHTLSLLQLRRHFPQLRCYRPWWQDLEHQVTRFQVSVTLPTWMRLVFLLCLSFHEQYHIKINCISCTQSNSNPQYAFTDLSNLTKIRADIFSPSTSINFRLMYLLSWNFQHVFIKCGRDSREIFT